jgi:Flp pilus assembly protein TadG
MKPLFEFFLRLAHCSSGSALVETAIVVPVAISLMAGAVDFGMALSTQTTLSKSVRNAARYMASLPTSRVDPATGNPLAVYCSSWAITNTKHLVVYGGFSTAGNTLISDWTTNGGTVSVNCSTPVATVQAQFPYKSIILSTFLPIASTITLSAKHEEAQVGQ